MHVCAWKCFCCSVLFSFFFCSGIDDTPRTTPEDDTPRTTPEGDDTTPDGDDTTPEERSRKEKF